MDYGIVKLYSREDKLWNLSGFGRGFDFTDGPSNNIISANDKSLIAGTKRLQFGRSPDSVEGVEYQLYTVTLRR